MEGRNGKISPATPTAIALLLVELNQERIKERKIVMIEKKAWKKCRRTAQNGNHKGWGGASLIARDAENRK